MKYGHMTIVGALLSLSGCATNLQKAGQLMQQGKHAEACRYYQREYDHQREQASEPVWKAERYTHEFSTVNTAEALYGMAETRRLLNEREHAAFCYADYVDFCLRHRLTIPTERQQTIDAFGRVKSVNP